MISRVALERGLSAMEVVIDGDALDQLLEYARQLIKWNRSYNLVSGSDLENLVNRHLLDSISIRPYLLPGSLLDVGTGAGFPGLPLAIIDPGLDVTLLDSVGKKVRFLRHIKRTLGLENIHPVESRVEDYESERKFDNICCRAFSSLQSFTVEVRHLADHRTRLLAMKGRRPEDELQALPGWLRLESVEKLKVADLHAERHLVIMSVSS